MGNVADLVRVAAAEHRGRPALLSAAGDLTWGDLDAAADGVAGRLRAAGLAVGDRVALSLGSTLEFAAAFFGALRAGLVAVPLNPAQSAAEAAHVLEDSGARLLVTWRDGVQQARDLRAQLPDLAAVWVADAPGAGPGELREPVGEAAFPDPRQAADTRDSAAAGGAAGACDEDLAVLLYTSGTSGSPRGVMLSHRALLADLDHVSRIDPPVVTGEDTVLLAVPLFHIFGLNSGLGMVARHAATGVLVDRADPEQTLATVRDRGVTAVVGVPQMYVAWSMLPQIDEAFDSVRMAVSGSAPLPPAVLQRILDSTGKHVFEGYGLTEAGPTVSSTLMSEVPKPGSIGRPVPGVRVRLVEPTGRPDAPDVEAEDAGEVMVCGDNLFSGYWPDGASAPGPEGWWSTGDLAYLDPEGDLHLVDRRRELIVVSGFNVYPREVEQVLTEHPDVLDAAVVGSPHPYTGEAVRALVVRRPGSDLPAGELTAWAARHLARFKCPTVIDFVAELPYTALGKVRRAELREAAGRDAGPGSGAP